jgi:hypothetical protein
MNCAANNKNPARRADTLAVLGLGLITLGFFWPALDGRLIFFPEDLHKLFYPMKFFYAESLRAGHLPLWNPYIFGGYPQYAEGQIATFYPFNLLLFGLLPLNLAFNYNVILHFALAGIFFYLFLRRRNLLPGAAFIGALTFEWSAFLVCHLQHPSIFCSVAWLPLLLYFLEDFLARLQAGREVTSRALAGGGVLALQLLVGYPPVIFYSLLIAGIYLLCRGSSLRKSVGVGPRIWLGAAEVLLVGFSLAAVQWLPTADFVRHAARIPHTVLQFMTSFSLTPRQLITFVFPHALGSTAHGTYVGELNFWEVFGYLGLISLCLLILGGAKRWSRAWPWVLIGLLGLGLSFGNHNPIYYVLQYLPGFNAFRAAGRYLLLWTVAGAVLAGEGTQYLLESTAQKAGRKNRLWAGVIIVLLGVWVVLQVGWYRILPDYPRRPAILPVEGMIFGCGMLLFAALALAARRGIAKNLILPALAIALLADLLAFARPQAPVTSSAFMKEKPWTARLILQDRSWYREASWRTREKTDSRYLYHYPWQRQADLDNYYQWDKARITPNLNIPWRLRTVQGDAAFLREVDFFFQDSENPDWPHYYFQMRKLVRILGVKYLVMTRPASDLELLAHRGRLWLYRDPAPLPRAWAVGAVEIIADSRAAGQRVFSDAFDPRQEAVLDRPLPVDLVSLGNIPVKTSWQDPRPEKIILHTSSASDSLLVLSEIYDPNWKVQMDGRETPLYRTDLFLRGVFLPAGEHDLVFSYDNLFFAAGLRVSLVAGLILGLVILRLRRKPSTLPPPV